MRITFVDSTSGRQINERSALTVVAKFWDDATEVWAAYTPTTVKYRLDNQDGTQITDWTTVSPSASVSIALTATQNAITGCDDEQKQLTVKANDGLSTQYKDTFVYRVKNLVGQT